MEFQPDTGVLLINLGTPDAPTPQALRRYLRQFLGDPRVLVMPALARWLLLELVILPRRPRKSAEAYRQIWTDEGSPLLVHMAALGRAVEAELAGPPVEIGMRYGSPSIEQGLERLRARGAERFVLLPLFPQRAEAVTGSIRAECERLLDAAAQARWIDDFYATPAFLEAWRAVAAPVLDDFQPDHVLLSYHGLQQSQIERSDPVGGHCLVAPDCCDAAAAQAGGCYRAQCFATTKGLVAALGLDPARVSTSFQSRLGSGQWIQPYTDEVFGELAARGVRRLAVLCPAFVTDNLETLEEIGLRGAEQWQSLGGEAFRLVPCPNASPAMATAVAALARDAGPFARPASRR